MGISNASKLGARHSEQVAGVAVRFQVHKLLYDLGGLHMADGNLFVMQRYLVLVSLIVSVSRYPRHLFDLKIFVLDVSPLVKYLSAVSDVKVWLYDIRSEYMTLTFFRGQLLIPNFRHALQCEDEKHENSVIGFKMQ